MFSQKNAVEKFSLRDTGIQTDVHPVCEIDGNSGNSYFDRRMAYLVRILL